MEDFFAEENTRTEAGSFDLRHFLSKLIANYAWIIISVLLLLFLALVYLRYSTPRYAMTGYIIVGGRELEKGTNDVLAEAGLVSSTDNTVSAVNNEIFILKSHILNGQVVDSLRLDVDVSKMGHLKDLPVLTDSLPVDIRIGRRNPNHATIHLNLNLRKNDFSLHKGAEEYKGSYGKAMLVDGDTLRINKKQGVLLEEDYAVKIYNRTNAIKLRLKQLTVEQAKNGGIGLLRVSVVDELTERGRRYIEILIHSYNVSFLDYHNQAIKRALVFLSERLSTVTSELSDQENALKDFKANNKIYDVSATATELLGNLQTLDTQKSQSEFQEQLLGLIESSIRNYSGREEIVASTNGLQDPVLGAQVLRYNELVFRKQMIQGSGAEADPRLANVNTQLADLRQNMLKNITNVRRQYRVEKQNVARQEGKFSDRFEVLPEKEKQFIGLNRKYAIKENQYIYLLQKREETELQLVSSNTERSRTVDDILNEGIVSPINMVVFGAALLLGLLIPAIIIFFRVLLNQKIETRKEIERGTKVPILGELSLSKTEDAIAISANNRTAIAEQLRAIRANLSFMGASSSHKVFVVTSSIGGEGKSFVSLNLGNSLAISNKRVAVLELDLRKPMLSKNLGITNAIGISNYIIDEDLEPEDIIQEVLNCPNLYLLNSGPVPPNPGELIIHPRMGELIDYLRSHFDFVILDSPPVGLVADSLSLAKLSDISLFVLRPNHSERSAMQLVNDLHRAHKLPRLSLIINGIQPEKGYGGYGNYGNKAYGYYSDDEEENATMVQKVTKLFKRF